MDYLVTGATGFIGRFLVEALAKRGTVHVLVRPQSADKFEGLQQRLGDLADQLKPVWGDIAESPVITDAKARKALVGKIDHVFHLAAVYDMNMDDEVADRINNEGTRNVVAMVNALASKERTPILHHVSSVAVAGGDFSGTFTEDMFDEGQSLNHPYFRTKYQSEGIVRDEATVPIRIYRPGMVLGHSETGEIDKVDGPYYFFKAIQQIRDHIPKWIPLLGVDGGKMPLAPVDYVVDAMVYLAHQEGLDGRTFHLVETPAPSVAEVMSAFFSAAHGPEMAFTFDAQGLPTLPGVLRGRIGQLPGLDLAKRGLSKTLGIPISVFGYIRSQAEFDDAQTRHALANSGISCPPLSSYAEVLWRFWETHLDTHVSVSKSLLKRVSGKTVLITGASSGIGFTTAKKLGKAGAKVLLVARTREKLEETQQVIERLGGQAWVYPCDLNDMEAIDEMAKQVIAEHEHVDILINNAGRSIRRSVAESLDRFHDFERTMQLNYFGSVRLILALLPSMTKRKKGQIINVSSIGVLTNVPRFSAYVASKAALDAFGRCLSAEIKHTGIEITTIYMPLVRTPMIAPTKLYDYVPTYTPDQAADLLVKAIVERPKRIKTALGQAGELSYALWPKVNDFILSQGYALFPSSSAARGGEPKNVDDRLTPKGVIFANLFRGTYW